MNEWISDTFYHTKRFKQKNNYKQITEFWIFGKKTHQNFCQGNRLKDTAKQLGDQQPKHFLDAQAPENNKTTRTFI